MKKELSLQQGWLIVIFWLIVIGVIWFIHSVAPGINDWLRDKQHLSGWFQGIGGILAIFAAFLIGNQQIRASRKIEADRRYFEISNKFAPLADILREVQTTCTSMRETIDKYRIPLKHYEPIITMYKTRLAEVNFSDYPAPLVALALTQLPSALEGVLERSHSHTAACDEGLTAVEKSIPLFYNTLNFAILLAHSGEQACKAAIERSR